MIIDVPPLVREDENPGPPDPPERSELLRLKDRIQTCTRKLPHAHWRHYWLTWKSSSVPITRFFLRIRDGFSDLKR
jgi:hypothetical protein